MLSCFEPELTARALTFRLGLSLSGRVLSRSFFCAGLLADALAISMTPPHIGAAERCHDLNPAQAGGALRGVSEKSGLIELRFHDSPDCCGN
jgi:hypothetical protein